MAIHSIPVSGSDAAPDRPAGRTWKLVTLFALAAAFLALLVFATLKEGSALQVGERVPNFEAPLLTEDGTFTLAEAKGQPVFINFWWSGCEPCKDEAPLLSRAHEVYGDDVRFVGVNIRDSHSDAVAFADAEELDFLHVRDESLSIYDEYGLTGQPESFFIDSDGRLVSHVAGPLSQDSMVRLLDALVARG